MALNERQSCKSRRCSVGRPKVAGKLSEAVYTSNSSRVDSGGQELKKKKRKLGECNVDNTRNKGRGRYQCVRKRQRGSSEDRSLDESFRIEIFETKRKPKIMLVNWKNFSELRKPPHRRGLRVSSVKGEPKRVYTRENVQGNVSANRLIRPCSFTARDCLSDSPALSTDLTAGQSHVAPMKIKKESGHNWAVPGTMGHVANVDCFVRLTRMEWLDKLSRKYDFP